MTAGVCRKGQLGTLKGDLRSIVEAVFAASNRAAELTFLVARGLSLRRVGDTAYFGAMMQDTGIIVLAKRGEARALDGAVADNGHPALGAAVLLRSAYTITPTGPKSREVTSMPWPA